jgi:CcmD family protein
MDNLVYLFVALGIAWALVFLYGYRLVRQLNELQKDLEMLRGQLEQEKRKDHVIT